ncbi:MAG: radical SAM protein [Deltaproteobacteria bacterium]|jgi:radical SAM protein with 4Fe4S-binding SPASM domain|nr:radical SAM protein [Deltaproteobacteria bacterium]
MTNQQTSSESLLMETAFSADRERRYARHLEFLNSDDPEIWRRIDFPLEISLELTNYCNLRCIMCPNPSMKRHRGYMSENLFKAIVNGLSGENGFLFLPQGFGEPLLHTEIFGLTTFASNCGIRPIVLLSNGMLLNEATLSDVMNSIDILIVTIDGISPRTYESVRVGGNLQTVTRNIERFLLARGDCKPPYLVLRIIDMKETKAEIAAFQDFWRTRISETDILQVSGYNDWTGTINTGKNHVKMREQRRPCRMLWKNLTVYHDGRVTPCCYDAEGELMIGSAGEESLRNIWEGTRLKRLRDLHLAHQFRKIPICHRCNTWF